MTLNSDGTYTFVPVSSFTGSVPVNYTITDTYGTGSATLNINVAPPANPLTNDPPLASNDTQTIEKGQTATVKVLANDSDPDGDALSVTGATAKGSGATTVSLTGTDQNIYDTTGTTVIGQARLAGNDIVFTPAAGYTGIVPFTYTISDGRQEPLPQSPR